MDRAVHFDSQTYIGNVAICIYPIYGKMLKY